MILNEEPEMSSVTRVNKRLLEYESERARIGCQVCYNPPFMLAFKKMLTNCKRTILRYSLHNYPKCELFMN